MSTYGGGENPYYNGGGGGGFVSGSPYGGGAGGSQGSPSGGAQKGRGNNTIRPVTIKQVIEATAGGDNDFTIDGAEVGNVLIVGCIRNIASSATHVTYDIEDGTGNIDARLWLDSKEEESDNTDGIEQDKYVVILGGLKTFGNKRHVTAQAIRPVTNFNEVFYHLLKSLHVSLSLRFPKMSAPGGAAGNAGAAQCDYAAGQQPADDKDRWAAMPLLHRKVLEIVGGDTSEDGVHVSHIARSISGTTAEDIMDTVEQLMSDGHLYSTIDDEHVKVAD